MPAVWLALLTLQSPHFSETEARRIVTELSSPKYAGRSPLTADYLRSAAWVMDWAESRGLKPAVPDYLQPFHLEMAEPTGLTAERTGTGGINLVPGEDFAIRSNFDVDASANCYFLHLPKGAELPASWKSAIEGNVVFVPSATLRNAEVLAAIQSAKPAVVNAISSLTRLESGGAIRIRELVPARAPFDWRAFRLSRGGVKKLATNLTDPEIAGDAPTAAFGGIGTLRVRAKVRIPNSAATGNIVFKIEGTDPKLRHEHIVIGAHLDHLGVNTTTKAMFPGADDNASGVAAVLLLAKAFRDAPVKPKRTVLVTLWTGEETGTFGSLFYSQRPVMPLKDAVAYYNLDMVGRDSDNRPLNDRAEDHRDAVYAGIARLNSPDFWAQLHRANSGVGLNLREDKDDRTQRSDTRNFVNQQVPTLKVWTGEHPDYHRATDTVDKINFPKMMRITQWLYASARELADGGPRPRFAAGAEYLPVRWAGKPEQPVPASAVATYELFEDDQQIDSVVQKQPNAFPIRFTLRYESAKLKSNARYRVVATIREGAIVLYRSEAVWPTVSSGRTSIFELPGPTN